MTAKEYLRKVKDYDDEIISLGKERLAAEEIIGTINSPKFEERVQTSNLPDPTARLGGELSQIDRDLATAIEKRQKIVDEIKSMPGNHRVVLTTIYIERRSAISLANDLHFSVKTARRMISSAENAFFIKFLKKLSTNVHI